MGSLMKLHGLFGYHCDGLLTTASLAGSLMKMSANLQRPE